MPLPRRSPGRAGRCHRAFVTLASRSLRRWEEQLLVQAASRGCTARLPVENEGVCAQCSAGPTWVLLPAEWFGPQGRHSEARDWRSCGTVPEPRILSFLLLPCVPARSRGLRLIGAFSSPLQVWAPILLPPRRTKWAGGPQCSFPRRTRKPRDPPNARDVPRRTETARWLPVTATAPSAPRSSP